MAHQAIVIMAKFTKIFATPVPTFFCLEKPISRNMKPACIRKTRMQATATHVMSSSRDFASRSSAGSWANAAPGKISKAASAPSAPRLSFFVIHCLLTAERAPSGRGVRIATEGMRGRKGDL